MKKILALLLALTVFSSVGVFAQTTVEHTFVADDGYVYHFGTFGVADEDAGLVINGKNYSLKGGTHACEIEGCNAFTHAQSNGYIFGMGIKLENGEESYTMAPYAITEGNEVKGETTIVAPTLSSSTEITSLTIADEEVDLKWMDNGTYYKYLPYGTTEVPAVEATAEGGATVEVNAAATLSDKTEIVITAPSGAAATYYVEYIVSDKESVPTTANQSNAKLYDQLYSFDDYSNAPTTSNFVYATHYISTRGERYSVGYIQLKLPDDIDLSQNIILNLNTARRREVGTPQGITQYDYTIYDMTDFIDWTSDVATIDKTRVSPEGNKVLLAGTDILSSDFTDPDINIDITEMVRACSRNGKKPVIGFHATYAEGAIPQNNYSRLEVVVRVKNNNELTLDYYKK